MFQINGNQFGSREGKAVPNSGSSIRSAIESTPPTKSEHFLDKKEMWQKMFPACFSCQCVGMCKHADISIRILQQSMKLFLRVLRYGIAVQKQNPETVFDILDTITFVCSIKLRIETFCLLF
jgi:hypothetical protein